MKITIVRKGTTGPKTMSVCPWMVDVPAEPDKK
jgi:hypothetical protein